MISDRLMNAMVILSLTLALWGLVVVNICHSFSGPAFSDPRGVEIAKPSSGRIEAGCNVTLN